MSWRSKSNELLYGGVVMALPRKAGDDDARLAARMVLLASAGKRVSLEPRESEAFCRHFLAYDEDKLAFWGRIGGLRTTGLNGHQLAAAMVASWRDEAPPSTVRAA